MTTESRIMVMDVLPHRLHRFIVTSNSCIQAMLSLEYDFTPPGGLCARTDITGTDPGASRGIGRRDQWRLRGGRPALPHHHFARGMLFRCGPRQAAENAGQ